MIVRNLTWTLNKGMLDDLGKVVKCLTQFLSGFKTSHSKFKYLYTFRLWERKQVSSYTTNASEWSSLLCETRKIILTRCIGK